MDSSVAISQGPPPSGLDQIWTSTLSEDRPNEWRSGFKDSRPVLRVPILLPECEGNATAGWVTQSVCALHAFELFFPKLDEDARQDDGISPRNLAGQGDSLMFERCIHLLLCHHNDAELILGQN